jgi:hypothetical protein
VILDAEHFVAVASDPLFADKMEAANGSPTIALGPYAVARLMLN